jgi:hypothetical protein
MLAYGDWLVENVLAPVPHGQPAFILYLQTFGDLVTFNPHILAAILSVKPPCS